MPGPDATPPSLDSTQPSWRSSIWLLRAAIAGQMISFGVLVVYDAAWMKDNGLDETMIGLVAAVSTLLGLVCGLGWGVLADRTGRSDRIIAMGCGGLALAAVVLAVSHRTWHFFGYAVLRGISYTMVWTLMPVLAMAAFGQASQGRRYGTYRIFGSAGFTVGTMLLPWLVPQVRGLLLIATASFAVACLPILVYRGRQPAHRAHGDLRGLLRKGELVGLYVSAFFFATGAPAVYYFTTLYAKHLGAGTRFLGLLNGTMGLCAIVALPIAGWVVDRYGPRRLVWLAMLAQPMRALTASMIDAYPWLLLPQLYHMLTWAGLEVGAVVLVSRLAGDGNRATGMAAYAAVMVLGVTAGAVVCGYMADHYGYPLMYRLAAASTALGLLIFTPIVLAHWRQRLAGRIPPPAVPLPPPD